MNIRLFCQAAAKFLLGVGLTWVLLFLPAGTLGYWNGWLLIVLLFLPMLIAGVCMMIKNPALLKKRLNARERQSGQKMVVALSGVMFVGGFILAGLGWRFQWFMLPDWLSVAAAVLLLLAYGMYAEVLRENAFLSRTVEIQQGQKVVDTGLYGVIRHPMYAATLVLFLSIPLLLGSLPAFLLFLMYPVMIVKRIRGEERLLEKELSGYKDYQTRVKYRLLPFIW